MPKIIEIMTTENKIEIRNVSMFIMKSFEIRKKLYFDQYAPYTFFLYTHEVELLIYNCIYNEGSRFVDMSWYLCIMNVYMFVYCLYTDRFCCLLYSEINSIINLYCKNRIVY